MYKVTPRQVGGELCDIVYDIVYDNANDYVRTLLRYPLEYVEFLYSQRMCYVWGSRGLRS